MDTNIGYEEQTKFKGWLDLNLNNISWEGRYLDVFNQVWELIFEPNILVSDQFKVLVKLESVLSQGPVISWIKWLKDKLVCYLFIEKDYTLKSLAEVSKLSYSEVSLLVRSFLIEHYPHLELPLSEELQVGNILSSNLNNSFKKISSKYKMDKKLSGSLPGEILASLEVTLYSDWTVIHNHLLSKQEFYKKPDSALKDPGFLNRKLRFLSELVILFLIAGLLIFLIKVGNKTYEEYLVEKISLFSPNFFWLDKNIGFKPSTMEDINQIDITSNELEELEKLENKKIFEDIQSSSRYEVETDVVLTSVDTLPKDFEVAGMELSEYEEERKGGYRNSRYGRRKAYRVMMTSVSPDELKKELIKILPEYGVTQVDNVKPGTEIPGGIYFNLYVPRKILSKFMGQVTSFEDHSTILESKTRFGGPSGMDKVFIWIKSI